MDPWYPLGYGDPLQAAFVLAHYGHMSGAEELKRLLEMITVSPARALGLADYGLETGDPASLVVYDAPGEVDAVRLIPRRRLVLRRGRVVARTEPARTTVTWDGREEPVDFLPAHGSPVSGG
jgi:cytosine deaminase